MYDKGKDFMKSQYDCTDKAIMTTSVDKPMGTEKIHLNDPKMKTATCAYWLLKEGEFISFRDQLLHK